MNKSESIKNLSTALSTFHGKVDAVKKDADNPFFKSKYASLDNIMDTIKVPLAESGLTFAQFPSGVAGLSTMLMHSGSGEWIEETFSVPLAKADPQGAGSAITYMRRYALGAILGLATETDDDGNAASATRQTAAPRAAGARQSEPSLEDLNSLEY